MAAELLAQPRRRLRNALIAIGSLIVLVLIAAYLYDRASASHLMPGTRIGGVLIGSRTIDDAEALLHERFVLPLRDPVVVSAPDFRETVSAWDLGLRLDVQEFVRDEHERQQGLPVPTRIWQRIFGNDGNASLAPQMNEKMLASFVARIDPIVDRPPADARLEIVGGKMNVIPHELGRDMHKDAAAAAIMTGLSSGHTKIDLPVEVTEPALKADAFTKVIVVSTSANHLTFYKDGKVSKSYRVATGTGGFPTPHGQFRITAKRMNPTWVNPGGEWAKDMPPSIGPGPNNPLGTRALNISASGIRIHGTPNDASIGTNASHGCIRMHMHEVEELFDQVDVGTPVLIVG
ncbi:MAG: L,D-transpeptidase/peptidoglycan binding protein [Actinomycetota bacterium]